MLMTRFRPSICNWILHFLEMSGVVATMTPVIPTLVVVTRVTVFGGQASRDLIYQMRIGVIQITLRITGSIKLRISLSIAPLEWETLLSFLQTNAELVQMDM